MANTLTGLLHTIIARGEGPLRGTTIMPRLVNTNLGTEAASKGSTITFNLYAAIASRAITPAATPPALTNSAPTIVSLVMDQWYENPFHLTDKEIMEIRARADYLPPQMEAAFAGLGDTIDASIFATYPGIYGYVGTAGTTPFGSGIDHATDAKSALAGQKCPTRPRYIVIDEVAEANATKLPEFSDASRSADANVIREGEIGRKLGFDWYMDQAVVTHTAGTASAKTVTCSDANIVGDTVATLKNDSGTSTLVVGDILRFANHTQTHTVVTAATLTTAGVAVTFAPGLTTAVDGSVTAVGVTVMNSHVVNLAFHRDAIAFASRPVAQEVSALGLDGGYASAAVIDPVTGIPFQLEVQRVYKAFEWRVSCLWGVKLVNAAKACRIAG